MPNVELIYDTDCPSVARARAGLEAAFAVAGLAPRWSERLAGERTMAAGRFGSPTILVDGRDVTGGAPGLEAACRVYRDEGGRLLGAPSVDQIAAALMAPHRSTSAHGGGWRRNLAVVPGIAASLLPKVACPACWPAYAGFLSTIGLGFLLKTTWLIPLTAVFLAVAVGALAFRASQRRGYRPAALGVVAATVVLFGKFGLDSDALMYLGLLILAGASLWNTWPRKHSGACEACATSSA
jgi:hypothetical protein